MQIKEITLQSTNISDIFLFYKNVLQMDVVRSPSGFAVTAGATKLIFEESKTTKNPFYHFAFNIPSNQFEEAFEWTKQKADLLWLKDYNGYVADFVNWHAKSFYFKDTAGNILEMIARFDLPNSSEEKFSAKSIVNVSEIGLVFPAETFDADIDELMKEYSLDYFEKQPPLPQFRAIGNDEGLFICVPENRIWFATDIESKMFPLEVTFNNKNKLHKLEMK
ncbi:MAG: VOC family protein [Ginsengibacter sp.]